MTLQTGNRKLAALRKLSTLSQRAQCLGDTMGYVNMKLYLAGARNILTVLGPEYDEAVALAVVRGLSRRSLRETVTARMLDKKWTLEKISNILMASVRGEV
ncbi:hypothetical protein TWF281_009588 [Arthrobotrys megalospora]